MKANLKARGIKYDERVLPRLNMTQLFYYDPDGIAVECNFPPTKRRPEPAWHPRFTEREFDAPSRRRGRLEGASSPTPPAPFGRAP